MSTREIVRNLLFFSLLTFWMPCKAMDFIDPYKSRNVDPKYAWKFGLSTASKAIGDETYFSLEINEKILCPVKEVGLVLWTDENIGKYIATKFLAGSYVANANINSYEKVTFSVNCTKHSTIHKYKQYELDVSGGNS